MLSGQGCQSKEAACLAVKVTKFMSNIFNFLGFDKMNFTKFIITRDDPEQ